MHDSVGPLVDWCHVNYFEDGHGNVIKVVRESDKLMGYKLQQMTIIKEGEILQHRSIYNSFIILYTIL